MSESPIERKGKHTQLHWRQHGKPNEQPDVLVRTMAGASLDIAATHWSPLEAVSKARYSLPPAASVILATTSSSW